jgi:endonuclease/exonuclease/phosphatase family metal-dependent hydrolase
MKSKILTHFFLIFMMMISFPDPINSGNCTANHLISMNKDETLKILTWNIFMLPHCNLINGNKKRARLIADILALSDYDIIFFEEAFDYRARRILRDKLGFKYPYIYGPANESFFSLRTNSGLWVLSRIPLVKIREIEYKNRFGIDAMARKGAVMYEGKWNSHDFQIVGTHLQADSPDEVRRQQCREIATELLDKYAKQNVPQFVCGDFNIEMEDTVNYHYMLSTLNAENGYIDGDICVSYDEINNSLAKIDNGKKRLIDYILLRNHSEKVTGIKRRISVIKGNIDQKFADLSDHYGVEALVSFR